MYYRKGLNLKKNFLIEREIKEWSIAMANKVIKVNHVVFGEGIVKAIDHNYISALFKDGIKEFVMPNAFDSFLTTDNEKLNAIIKNMLSEQKRQKEQHNASMENDKKIMVQKEIENTKDSIDSNKLKKKYPQRNIAFKCNYCNGGCTNEQLGFNGVCSDDLIQYNIEVAKHVWCSSEDSECFRYYNGEITRNALDDMMREEGFVCYESQMLDTWTAFAGIVQTGERKGTPMKLNKVQSNSLCVLTTRAPSTSENERCIFAVFLVDDSYEGDSREAGYVSTKSEYKIKLSSEETKKMKFWNYHSNDNQPDVTAWNSGLHRYFENREAAQILRDVAIVKNGTRDEGLANEFFKHFCKINKINVENLTDPSGALKN